MGADCIGSHVGSCGCSCGRFCSPLPHHLTYIARHIDLLAASHVCDANPSPPCALVWFVSIEFHARAGKKVCWSSFSSASLSDRAAQDFLTGEYGLIFIIEGRSARLIEDFSDYPSEREMLFPPNMQFKVKYLAKVTDWYALAFDSPHSRIRVTEAEAKSEDKLIIVMEEE